MQNPASCTPEIHVSTARLSNDPTFRQKQSDIPSDFKKTLLPGYMNFHQN